MGFLAEMGPGVRRWWTEPLPHRDPGEAEVPLVVHVIFRLDTGGMENGLVNLINRTPVGRYRHAIVCLTDAGEFARRIARPDVVIVSLRRPPGHSFLVYFRLWRVLRQLGPALSIPAIWPRWSARSRLPFLRHVKRVHGEHGRDIFDLHGRNRRYNALRRAIRPLVHRYIAVSLDLEGWLREAVGVSPSRIRQIYNGVAVELFQQGDAPSGMAPPASSGRTLSSSEPSEGLRRSRTRAPWCEPSRSWWGRTTRSVTGFGLSSLAMGRAGSNSNGR